MTQETAINLPAAIQLCGGKESIAREIIQMLINELPQQAQDLHAALGQQNWHDMDYISHKLAGSAAYCGMELLKKYARTLNTAIRQQQWAEVNKQASALQHAITLTLAAAEELSIVPQN